MTAVDPDAARFFVDETSMGLAKTLEAARRDVIHPGHRFIPEVPTGTIDPVWIPEVARRGLILIGRDKHIRTRPGEQELLRDHGLRVFRLATKRDLTTWGYLLQIVRHWNEVERIVRERGPGPWFYAVVETRISEIPV